MQHCTYGLTFFSVTLQFPLGFHADDMSAMVKVLEKPFKRYWVVKVYDSEVTGKDLFTVIVPSWCQPDNLKCQFPADLIVSSKVSARVQLLKPPASDWVTFDYAYFSQTGKCKFCIL